MAIGISLTVGGLFALACFSGVIPIPALRGLGVLIILLLSLMVAGGVFFAITTVFGGKSSRCPDEGWPVEAHRPAGFTTITGKDTERSDEKELRMWSAQAKEKLASGSYALQVRNAEYARSFIEANGGDPTRIQTIAEKI